MSTFFARTLTEKQKVAELIRSSDSPLVVDIEQGDVRSIQSNKRYWAGVVTATQNHLERTTGQKYTKEAVHHFFKVEIHGKKVDVINGKVYERVARSSKMTQKQFSKFAEKAEFIAIDIGVEPSEIDYHARGGEL